MDHNTQYEPQGGNTAPCCLGYPSHALQAEEVVCRICGALAARTTLGIYEIQKLLGIGRSGHAYLAHHQRSGQSVAVKLFSPQSAHPELWEAARREIRMTTALRHPSILPVFSCNTWSPVHTSGETGANHERQLESANAYLLTLCQYIPGTFQHFTAYLQKNENQRALYEYGSSPRTLVIHVLQQIASALQAAHTRGVAHGAIVPGNILFASYEHACLADFGLSRLQPPPTAYLPPELSMAAQASQQGNITAYWKAANPAGDQYMFAVLCQQIFNQALQRHEYEPLLPILNRAMHPKPERRYPTLNILLQDFITVTTKPSNQLATKQFKQPINAQNSLSTPIPNPSTPLPTGSWHGSGIAEGVGNLRGSQSQRHNYSATPLPAIVSGPLTPALAATPLTPTIPLTAEDWEKRGDKLFTMHEYEEALVAYHRAVEVKSGKALLWLALGDTYFALERYKEALMAYEQALYLNPNDSQTWLNRGTTLDALGRHNEAVDCYERSDQLRSA